jgi:hypothetical protein
MAPRTRNTPRQIPHINKMDATNSNTQETPFDSADYPLISAARSNTDALAATSSNTTNIQQDSAANHPINAANSNTIDSFNTTSTYTTNTKLDSATRSGNKPDEADATDTQSTSHQIDAAKDLIDGIVPPLDATSTQSTSHESDAANTPIDGTPIKNNHPDGLNVTVSEILRPPFAYLIKKLFSKLGNDA